MQVLSNSLLELLAENSKLMPANEVRYFKGNPYFDCQNYDGLAVIRINVISNNKKEAIVLVNIRSFKDCWDKKTITLKLVARRDGWGVDDFINQNRRLRASIEQENQMHRAVLSQQTSRK